MWVRVASAALCVLLFLGKAGGAENGRTGRDLLEVGCKAPVPSRECEVMVDVFASGLGFSYAYHYDLLLKHNKLSSDEYDEWRRLLMYGMCIHRIDGKTKAQAVAEYLAENPSSQSESAIVVMVSALKKYWPCTK